MPDSVSWTGFRRSLLFDPKTCFRLDFSRMGAGSDSIERMDAPLRKALEAMRDLEKGGIANPDENRMVGHYWLRDPELAPTADIRRAIEETRDRIKDFVAHVNCGEIRPKKARLFRNLLVIGIGGSALGPQLVASALSTPDDRMRPFFLDNTDPDGMDRIFAALGPSGLKSTLTIVISKSGGTKETRNGMLEAAEAYRRAGIPFAQHAVAVTSEGSQLDGQARDEKWLARFPMWDWVGGRTSVTSAVGLLPAALQGIDTDAFLDGAAAMDVWTRAADPRANPAAMLAAMWHLAGDGRGCRDMVIIPYKDRLELFAKYLQQLVMESLGKEKDLAGSIVNQGLSVYGNKGSTDQHSYIQQLRDGLDNFFVTFIQVLRDREGKSIEVEPGITSGDYLLGFLLGTRRALYEKGRRSMTVTMPDVSPASLGALIALYERAVGLYASLINVNAYHQPGVEAGKKAAGEILALQRRVLDFLKSAGGRGATVEEIAKAVGAEDDTETVFHLLEHLAANPDRGVGAEGSAPFDRRYRAGR
ncbi:MAG: glucose-6-phosphate isomerase [Planctomycetota bacterium]|nr:glucose-6-phosphate isomerase [Planctomycetota bacterium]